MTTRKYRIIGSLNSIKGFYERVNKSIGEDLAKIEELNESGEYPEYGDYESSWDTPVYHLMLARKLTFIELNIFIEDTLKEIAIKPWYSKNNISLYDYMLASKNPIVDLKKFKDVNDLITIQLVKLIEDYYKINLNSLPKYDIIIEVREIANAYKHNDGYKKFSKIKDTKENIFQLLELDEEKLFASFKGAEEFLIALTDVVDKEIVKLMN